ncbi:transcription termination/antitermination NusG family protein [Kistimonas asteriae]|uniref:transcription termination/antitermination NusG family protein n=1 Tax=Kistimonas asteriae TaxID=517724 RepID=UPI001BA49D4C|nr:transcription termination/antitermination NusG family protein [Kistimonas asteriae]
MDEWYLLRSKPRQEQRAVENLERQGFTAYCPMLEKKKARVEPLFPGYVFLQHDAFEDNPDYGKVRSTRGVMTFVRFGDEFAKVPEELLEGVRHQEHSLRGSPAFEAGQVVGFTDGPFAEIQAIYLCDRGEERSVVLLNVLNREQRLVVRTENLRKHS